MQKMGRASEGGKNPATCRSRSEAGHEGGHNENLVEKWFKHRHSSTFPPRGSALDVLWEEAGKSRAADDVGGPGFPELTVPALNG